MIRRLPLVTITIFALTACGGSQSAEPTMSSETAMETPPEGQDLEQDSSSQDSSSPELENEFQLQVSDDADQAHGEHPSNIEATPTHAAMRLFVVNPDTGPVQGIVIKLAGPDGTAYYTAETDSQGYAEVLVPAGQRYQLEYLSLGRRNTRANVAVPPGPHQDIRLTLRYRRIRPPAPPEAPEPFVLEGVTFATARATIQPESHTRLDRVVEYLTHRSSIRIRIEGHTDNTGNPESNQRLSEARARAVRQYLISHGISGNRIEAVGYGDERPIATNDTEEGRAQNRRIEAYELEPAAR